MLDSILKTYTRSTFDFREFACPDDELSYLFDERVDYYRLKYAIAATLQPSSILEIGVRYGYSAVAFLHACPHAQYTGIDKDSDTYGGVVGAIQWAERITKDYHSTLLRCDSQLLAELPGSHYDLVHIDGQQDGDGTFHDLELALEKGQWILIDGFFWSSSNMLGSMWGLRKYRSLIEWAGVIPGYAGELLIKTNKATGPAMRARRQRYCIELENAYSKEYFLTDCGGYDTFIRFGGHKLLDERLVTMYILCGEFRKKRILDVGCGRGELAYALASNGAYVTGVDYSPVAIDIATNTYLSENTHSPPMQLEFVCADMLTYAPVKHFDIVIMADFVEHIGPQTFVSLLKRVAGMLIRDGVLFVHTAPNLDYYRIEYSARYEAAKNMGLFIPKNPRTYFEDLMHINEQTPKGLREQLSLHFANVIVWFPYPDTAGTLREGSTDENLSKANEIYAVAANRSLSNKNIIDLLSQQPLATVNLADTLELMSSVLPCFPGQRLSIRVRLSNHGKQRLSSLAPFPVHLSYHWENEQGDYEVYDGERTRLDSPLQSGESIELDISCIAPIRRGEHTLEVTLVQEGCFWFEQYVLELPVKVKVLVKDTT